MSELKYFITAKTKGDAPMVMFLSDRTVWQFETDQALAKSLDRCSDYGAIEPTHCLFVEAKASLKIALDVIIASQGFVTPAELKQLVKKHDCNAVSTKQNKRKPAKEEPREYLLYYRLIRPITNSNVYYFCLPCGLETTDRNQAYLMTLAEAEAKQQELEKKGEYKWLIEKQPATTEPLQPAQDVAATPPQKRVGYVLFKEGSGGEKHYKCETGLCAIVSDSLNLTVADVFMTKKQADFACYALNRIYNTTFFYSLWKVEQIEF